MSNILIIGDIILDHYVLGDVNRVSPEAPVPILEFTEEFYRLGGAANVANNLNKSSNNVTLKGVGGFGFFKQWSALLNGKTFYSKIDLNNPAFLTKTRFASNHHYLLRLDRGSKYEQSFMNLTALEEDIESADTIIISDYCKGTITPEVVKILNRYKKYKKFIVDSKNHIDKSIYLDSFLITPNTEELKKLLKSDIVTTVLVDEFLATYNIKHLLHTMGKNGMELYFNYGTGIQVVDYAVTEQQVIDVTGAGDTVVATIADHISNGVNLDFAIKMANMNAAIACSKFGTSTI
jgi:rfaE bifunctional protein kinase chain/domain